MKFFRTLLIAVALVPVGISFTSSAFAASKAEGSQNILSGTVVGIDRSARTLLVRDSDGHKTTVHVPEGRMVALSQNGNVSAGASQIEFERAHRGLQVRMVIE